VRKIINQDDSFQWIRVGAGSIGLELRDDVCEKYFGNLRVTG